MHYPRRRLLTDELSRQITIGQRDGLLRESPLFRVEDLHHTVGMHSDVPSLSRSWMDRFWNVLETNAWRRCCQKELLSWALAALQRTAEQGRKTMGEEEVARVLARAPGAPEDGVWLSRAARELLESGRHGAFEDGFFIAKINLPGGTSRAIGEGGEQERALATGFRTDARGPVLKTPRKSISIHLAA